MAEKVFDYGYLKKTWSALYWMIYNPYGRAGVLGNMYRESKVVPYQRNGVYTPPFTASVDYTKNVDDNYSIDEFANDGVAYGLVQWLGARKRGLYNQTKDIGYSVGDFERQIVYLRQELNGDFKSVLNALNSATTIDQASDIFLMDFEKPGGIEKEKPIRRDFSRQIYDMLENGEQPNPMTISITPSVNTLSLNQRVRLTVSASGEWGYTKGNYIDVSDVTNNGITVTATSDVNAESHVLVNLLDDIDVYAYAAINIKKLGETDYIMATPKKVISSYKKIFRILVNASEDWTYTAFGSRLIAVDNIGQDFVDFEVISQNKGMARIEFRLSGDPNINVTTLVYVNGENVPPGTGDYIKVYPKNAIAKLGQTVTFDVDTNGNWWYKLPNGIELIDKTDSKLRVMIRSPSTNYVFIQFYLQSDTSIFDTCGIKILNATPIGKKTKKWIYYLKRLI